jgi:hypothetical protein
MCSAADDSDEDDIPPGFKPAVTRDDLPPGFTAKAARSCKQMSLCPLPPPSPLHNVPEGVLAGQLLSVLEAVHILRPVIGSALHSKLRGDCTITSPLAASLLGHARVCASLKSLVTALVTGEADSSDDDAPGELQSPSVVWAATEEKLQEKVVAACRDDEAADVSYDQENAAASMATNSGFLSAALIRAARVGDMTGFRI